MYYEEGGRERQQEYCQRAEDRGGEDCIGERDTHTEIIGHAIETGCSVTERHQVKVRERMTARDRRNTHV